MNDAGIEFKKNIAFAHNPHVLYHIKINSFKI